MSAYAIIFDLDGCLADWSHRLHYIEIKGPVMDPKPNADWDAFYDAMPDDPVLPGAVLYNLLVNQSRFLQRQVALGKGSFDVPVVDILTCRPEKMRAVTESWFERNGLLKPRAMHMRADDDDRPHAEIKLEMYRQHYLGKEEVIAVFDDNPDIIAAFRSAGVMAYHVA